MRGIAIARGIGTPPILMAITWAGLFLLFYLGPAEYQQSPSVSTWLLAALGLVTFSIGCTIALSLPVSGSAIPATVIEKAILLSSALGLIGAALIVLDKVLLSGLDYSQGLTSVRYMRIDQINAGIEIERSPLLYLGYLTFSFSYASVTLYFLEAERVRRLPAVMAQLAVLAPIAYAVLFGARAPVLILCILLVAAALVRKMGGRRATPTTSAIRIKLLVFFGIFLAYVNVTWENRREISRVADYKSFLNLADRSWKLRPSGWLDESVRSGYVGANTAMDALSITVYATHSLVYLDKIVEHRNYFSPYLGAFEIGILSPILRVFFPDSELLKRMQTELESSDLYGWFVSAWGALYLDFGLTGAIVAILGWGLLSGYSFRAYLTGFSPTSALMLSFWLGSIMLSPLNSPIGLANSIQVLASFYATALFISISRRYYRAGKPQFEEVDSSPA